VPIQQVTAPAGEPIALAFAKLHIRQDNSADDTLISAFISASRDFAETQTGRQLIGARYRLILDSFPGPSLQGVPFGEAFTLPGHAILLPKSPVVAVESIQYTAMDGTTQTMAPADYTVDLACEPARITPVFGKIWPIPLPQIGSVQVSFVAGYAAPITANAGADTVAVQGPWKTMAVNDIVRFSNSGGALPAGLAENTDYYVKTAGSGVYTVSLTQGGATVDITDAGTGLNFVGVVPKGIVSWMLLRMGSIYQNREEVALLNRGKIEALPYVDGLLDPYRVWMV
jgi:uncharacterized phiE125 gp8 family phage protein